MHVIQSTGYINFPVHDEPRGVAARTVGHNNNAGRARRYVDVILANHQNPSIVFPESFGQEYIHSGSIIIIGPFLWVIPVNLQIQSR